MSRQVLPHHDAECRGRIVDVGAKPETDRAATARAMLRMSPRTAAAAAAGDAPKGDVIATARLAAMQAAKRTDEWIPLAHPLLLTAVDVGVDIVPAAGTVTVTVTAHARARTGVEMEAMVGCAAGALTIYDMVKGLERGVVVERVELLKKSGGRSGTWSKDDE